MLRSDNLFKEEIYYLSDYNWEIGFLLKENKTTYQIDCGRYGIKNIKKEKTARPNDLVCIVWETWRGTNGRGGYRVEKQNYRTLLIPAKQVSRQHCSYYHERTMLPTGRIEEDKPSPQSILLNLDTSSNRATIFNCQNNKIEIFP